MPTTENQEKPAPAGGASPMAAQPGARPRAPFFERVGEAVVRGISALHGFLARNLTSAFTWLWRIQGGYSLPKRFSVGMLLLAIGSAGIAVLLPMQLPLPQEMLIADGPLARIVKRWPSLFIRSREWAETNPAFIRYLENAGRISAGTYIAVLAIVSCLLALVAALVAFRRRKSSFGFLKIAWAFHFVVLCAAVHWVTSVPKALNAADYKAFDDFACKEILIRTIFTAPFAFVVPVLVLVALLTVEARRLYCGDAAPQPSFGSNAFIANLKTGGEDPRFRSSCYWAVFLFVFALVAPFIIHGCGTEGYDIPGGDGEVAVEQVKVKPKPKKKQKKLMVDPWSPYILERINIDDAKVLDELQEQTQDTYQADRTKKGKLGKGKGGRGGWPKGMEGAKVRFIRLEYGGGNWDQEMGKSGDYNLLIRFNQLTGLPVAAETEHRKIERLAHFAKKKAPPFVFMTGSGNINISASEAKILRNYCEVEGGMLFIDCGGGHFGRSVRNMLAKVFPGKSLVDIPNDDPIYQAPYIFPDGAPRFWHHDGNRALAIRHEGRIVAFYHPGDVKDAWKDGHSGVTPEVADQAYKLGVNVIYYAFNQYYRRHYDQSENED